MAKAPSRGRPALRQQISSEIVISPAVRRKTAPAQPELFSDPMPSRVEPCLARAATHPPAGAEWSYEVKWDGYRLAIHIEPGGRIRIITRGGFDWTDRFPDLVEAAAALAVETAILDGEAVVLDDQGRSDFAALQAAFPRSGKARSASVHFYAFDLLYLDGVDYRRRPQSERRHALTTLIPRNPSRILLSEDVVADGSKFLRLACTMGLEGIIAKKRSAPYRSGRGGEWLKIKCVQSETFAIIGYRASKRTPGGIAQLFLAAKRGDNLDYVGSVGTGFTAKAAASLLNHLRTLEIEDPPVANVGANKARWVRPMLAAEIEFRGWTANHNLRHASYKGLRGDAEAAELFELPN